MCVVPLLVSGPGEKDIFQPLDLMMFGSLLWHLINHRLKVLAFKALIYPSSPPSGRCPQPFSRLPQPSYIVLPCPLELLATSEYGMSSPASVRSSPMFLPLGILFPLFSGQQIPIHSFQISVKCLLL